ncbi:YitT family protein [Clostridium lundense]|uniref:YitT family protein n=1 Tax=Clostridium lundense TaxID=319475 RepID=UPI000481E357|nr:YitT family protein [Clostridium lundense]
MELKRHINKENGKNIIFIILGTLISAIGVNVFLVNAKLLSGGVSGITLIIQYIFKIPAGYTLFAINIPLLYLSYKKMNKKFTLFTLVGTVSFSIMLIITTPLNNLISINDPLLLCLYGGLLVGIGIGMAFSNYGSTGGMDIVIALLKKKHENLDIGNITFGVNCIIVIMGAFIFNIKSALYTLVSMYITSYMIDKVVKGFNREKMILIITDKEDEVSKKIMANLKRGVTFLQGEGAYTKKSRKVLYCVVSLSQLPQLKQMVREIDENAFISILDASEVEGKGFTKSIS